MLLAIPPEGKNDIGKCASSDCYGDSSSKRTQEAFKLDKEPVDGRLKIIDNFSESDKLFSPSMSPEGTIGRKRIDISRWKN